MYFLISLTGDKPHGCELCSKKFALACNLRAHMKTHEGEFRLKSLSSSNEINVPLETHTL